MKEFDFVHPDISEEDRQTLLNGFPPEHMYHTTKDGHPNQWVANLETLPIGNHETLAHIMTRAGLFSSVSQARKNGWDKPIPKGFTQYVVGKNKTRITTLIPWEVTS